MTDTAPRTFLGLDGGQTGTRAVLVDARGTVLRRATSDGLIHALRPGGAERLGAVLADVRAQVEPDGRAPDVVFLGLTAIVPGQSSEPVGVAAAEGVWPASHRIVEGDGIVAWAGATGGAPGVAAMAGTGSVVVAVNERGERAESGGWAYVFGDAGSGWQIGAEAVRRMLRRWDRERSLDLVGRTILGELGAGSPADVPDRFYDGDLDTQAIARLARPVLGLAAGGDPEARTIVGRAAADFAIDVAAAIDRLSWEREPVRVGTLGGIFRAGPVYREPFARALRRRTTHAVVLRPPVLDGLGGATLLALRAGGVPITPELVATLAGQGMGGGDA